MTVSIQADDARSLNRSRVTAQGTADGSQIEPSIDDEDPEERTIVIETPLSVAARAQVINVSNKIDPFGLRNKYPNNGPLHELLDIIEKRTEGIKSNQSIDLSNVDFKPISSGITDDNNYSINLERLLSRVANRQYPLIGAKLEGADLTIANLDRANLKGVNLTKANLWMTSLKGADLCDAFALDDKATKIFKGDELKKYLIDQCAIIDDSTKFLAS